MVDQFRECATRLAQNSAIDQVKKYDRIVERIGALFSRLKLEGDPGLDALQTLLKDPSPWVRLAAGSCLIDHRTDAAVEALDELARRPGGSVNSKAEIHLFMWYYDRTGKYYEPGEKLEY